MSDKAMVKQIVKYLEADRRKVQFSPEEAAPMMARAVEMVCERYLDTEPTDVSEWGVRLLTELSIAESRKQYEEHGSVRDSLLEEAKEHIKGTEPPAAPPEIPAPPNH